MENGELIMNNDERRQRINVVEERSYQFSIRIINLYKYLDENKKIYDIAHQLLRSGTAIGALIKEAVHAQSKADFLNKMNVALKEANETIYWLSLLHDTNYLKDNEFLSINNDCEELLKLLISIVKTTKNNLNR